MSRNPPDSVEQSLSAISHHLDRIADVLEDAMRVGSGLLLNVSETLNAKFNATVTEPSADAVTKPSTDDASAAETLRTMRPGGVMSDEELKKGLELLRSIPVPEGYRQEPSFEAAIVSPPGGVAELDNRARWKHAYHPEALTDEERAHLQANGVDVP